METHRDSLQGQEGMAALQNLDDEDIGVAFPIDI